MSTRSTPEDEVWEREVASWEHLKVGDLRSYLSLLHDDVVAWPSHRSAPVNKDAIFQHLVAMLPALQSRALDVELRRLSVRLFDDVGVVHYEAHTRLRGRLGRDLPDGERHRFTRTWLRTENGWKLIAGMSAPITGS